MSVVCAAVVGGVVSPCGSCLSFAGRNMRAVLGIDAALT